MYNITSESFQKYGNEVLSSVLHADVTSAVFRTSGEKMFQRWPLSGHMKNILDETVN